MSIKILNSTEEENGDGYIEFEHMGYHYHIGVSDDGNSSWFQRQTIDDYFHGRDNWEETEWHRIDGQIVKKEPFKFLK